MRGQRSALWSARLEAGRSRKEEKRLKQAPWGVWEVRRVGGCGHGAVVLDIVSVDGEQIYFLSFERSELDGK